MKTYYNARAGEYDEWYVGGGLFGARDRPRWDESVAALTEAIAALPPARTLDVACGTGFLTRHLPGEIIGLDQSERMLAIARERVPRGTFVQGDALALPFEDRSFERLFTGHFYGHLETAERRAFLTEAWRTASELIVVDAALRPDHARAEWQDRELNDRSKFTVFKRFFDPQELAAELGGGSVLHANPWFVMVSSQL